QPQHETRPFEPRRLKSAATVKRSFLLFSASWRQEAISSHTARHGDAAFSPSRWAKPAGEPNGKSKPRRTRSPRAVAFDNNSLSKFFALCRVCGFSIRRSEPSRSTAQIQML